MMPSEQSKMIVADVGNSRIKIGAFGTSDASSLPAPMAVCELTLANGRTGQFPVAELDQWCHQFASPSATWYIASVFPLASEHLVDAIRNWSRRADYFCAIQEVTYRHVPLEIRVEEPARVGIDRLLGAVAVNQLRKWNHPAVVIDLGTAITVDLVEADGAFSGGAILPGIAMSAQALHDHTAALPLVAMQSLELPSPAPAKSTTAAIEAGLYWGAVGAIRELVSIMSDKLDTRPELFLTGGASPRVAESLASTRKYPVHYVPHLVLSGIAITAGKLRSS